MFVQPQNCDSSSKRESSCKLKSLKINLKYFIVSNELLNVQLLMPMIVSERKNHDGEEVN